MVTLTPEGLPPSTPWWRGADDGRRSTRPWPPGRPAGRSGMAHPRPTRRAGGSRGRGRHRGGPRFGTGPRRARPLPGVARGRAPGRGGGRRLPPTPARWPGVPAPRGAARAPRPERGTRGRPQRGAGRGGHRTRGLPRQRLHGAAGLARRPHVAVRRRCRRGGGTAGHRRAAPGRPAGRAIDRFQAAHSPLDLGPDRGEVGPGRPVRYVPTAALVVRRTPWSGWAGFAPGLRVGEDVDLVWRLVDAGWRVRYEPAVIVHHAEPGRWRGPPRPPAPLRHLGRAARRTPPRPAGPGRAPSWPTAAALALLAGRPALAALPSARRPRLTARTVRPLGIPPRQALGGAAGDRVDRGRASAGRPPCSPGPAPRSWPPAGGPRAAGRPVVVPPVVDWRRDARRWTPSGGWPPRWRDDVAYGTGVWIGCRHRTGAFGPVLPARCRRRPGRGRRGLDSQIEGDPSGPISPLSTSTYRSSIGSHRPIGALNCARPVLGYQSIRGSAFPYGGLAQFAENHGPRQMVDFPRSVAAHAPSGFARSSQFSGLMPSASRRCVATAILFRTHSCRPVTACGHPVARCGHALGRR